MFYGFIGHAGFFAFGVFSQPSTLPSGCQESRLQHLIRRSGLLPPERHLQEEPIFILLRAPLMQSPPVLLGQTAESLFELFDLLDLLVHGILPCR